MFVSGGGYFVKTKLYSTIAEAQAPDYSRTIMSYGPVTTFLALGGIALALIKVVKNVRQDMLFLTIVISVAC